MKYQIKNKEDIIYFINWVLKSPVDYVYVLEALVRMLEGNQKDWEPDHYIDY